MSQEVKNRLILILWGAIAGVTMFVVATQEQWDPNVKAFYAEKAAVAAKEASKVASAKEGE